MEKVVCFAGHRDSWRCIGVEDKLKETLEQLIQKGYTTFYDGGKGAFDSKCVYAVLDLKKKYKNIKLIHILTYYHHDKEKWELPPCFDGSLFPDIEECHPKQRITKRNEWIVDNSDILVCHIEETYKSGAYNMVKYAKKVGKPIIYI